MEQLVVATCCLCVCKITSGHAVFNADVEKEIECRSHREEPVRFYCDDCDTCVCVLCTFHAHRGHRVLSFHDAAARQVRPIAAAVAWSVCLCVFPCGCHAPRAACCYTCTPGCRLQGRAGSKILHQQNPPVLNWMCRCDYTG